MPWYYERRGIIDGKWSGVISAEEPKTKGDRLATKDGIQFVIRNLKEVPEGISIDEARAKYVDGNG